MPGARPLPSRAIPAAAVAAGLCAAAILTLRDPPPPRRVSALIDDTPHPSGRPHDTRCPFRDGMAMNVETAWR